MKRRSTKARLVLIILAAFILNCIPIMGVLADTEYTVDQMKAKIEENLSDIQQFNDVHHEMNKTNILYYDSKGDIKLYDSSIALMELAEQVKNKPGYSKKIIDLVNDVNRSLSAKDKDEIIGYIAGLGLVDGNRGNQTPTQPGSGGGSSSSGGASGGGGGAAAPAANNTEDTFMKTTNTQDQIRVDIDKTALAKKIEELSNAQSQALAKKEIAIKLPQPEANKTLALNIPSDILAASKNKDISFNISTDAISLIIPTDVMINSNSNTVTLNIKPVSEAIEASKALKAAGSIYELNLYSIDDNNTKSEIKNFSKDILVAVDIADEYKKSEKLGAYFYDEAKGQWQYIGGKLNASTGKFEFTTNHFSKYAVFEYNKTFVDIKDHWAKSTIEVMTARHIIDDRYGDSFEPKKNTTRAEFAVWMVRALGIGSKAAESNFKDVAKDAWYYREVSIANREGLIQGYAGRFEPDKAVTRQEMAVMMKRALDYSKKSDIKLTEKDKADLLKGFEDKGKIASWALDASAELVKLNMLNGKTATKYSPLDMAQRGEAITIIKRFMDIKP